MSEWQVIWEAREAFASGTLTTLLLFGISTLIAFVLGSAILFGFEKGGWLAKVLRGFTNLMRMVPFLVLAYLLYYGLPRLGLRMSAWSAGLLALSIYHAAYFAEILRGARIVMPKGYVEAAKALGFTPLRMFIRIILPQLVIKTRPLLGNQLVMSLKDTAFLTIITVQELTAAANSVSATNFIPMEAFIVAIALYWAISICLELALKWAARFGIRRGFENA